MKDNTSARDAQTGRMHPKGKHALTLARMGYRVFPLPVDDPNKTPSEIKKATLKDWPTLATTDPAQIIKWWEEADYNIGVVTSKDDRLVIIDYDCKPGQQGAVALANHRALDIPETMAVETPTGGLHLYMVVPKGVDIPNSVSKVALHVDVRGQSGGYVLGPGSTIHGKPYKIVSGRKHDELEEIPFWLIRKAMADHKKTDAKKGEVLGTLDTDEAIARATTWLKEEAPEAIEGAGGNNTTYQVACRVKDFGVSKEQCLELLATVWNEAKAAPVWDFDALSDICENAYRYATLPVGIANAAAEFAECLVPSLPAPQLKLPPLTVAEWMARELPEPDWLMGSWLSTTSRGFLIAPTGLGKTNFGLALAMAVAAGRNFLHWRGRRPARVLYIDGEMSRRLLKQRIADAARRLGEAPAGFHTLSHEDIEGFAPLNTKEGRKQIEAVIKAIGGVDLIIFDSVMCLMVGDPKEPESWSQIMPWVRSLTKRGIGQIWVHHTGIDESHGYGDKTKEWQFDLVMQMNREERIDSDVAFKLGFPKKRECTPQTRADFADVSIALIGDEWTFKSATKARREKISPLANKFFAALLEAQNDVPDGCGVSMESWRIVCSRRGLIDPDKSHSVRTLMSKYRRELIAANYIACDNDTVHIVSRSVKNDGCGPSPATTAQPSKRNQAQPSATTMKPGRNHAATN